MTLGTLLVESGVLAPERLEEAVREQRRTGDRLEQVLIRMGFVHRSDLLRTFSERLHLPIVDLTEAVPDADVLRLLPPRVIFKLRCAPVARTGRTLRIATSDPTDLASFDELRIVTGHAIELVLADEEDLQKYIRQHYGVAGDTLDALGGTRGNGHAAECFERRRRMRIAPACRRPLRGARAKAMRHRLQFFPCFHGDAQFARIAHVGVHHQPEHRRAVTAGKCIRPHELGHDARMPPLHLVPGAGHQPRRNAEFRAHRRAPFAQRPAEHLALRGLQRARAPDGAFRCSGIRSHARSLPAIRRRPSQCASSRANVAR